MIIACIFGNPCFTIFGNPNSSNQFLITIFGNDKIGEKPDKIFKTPLFKHDTGNNNGFEFGLPLLVIFYSIPCSTGKAGGSDRRKIDQDIKKRGTKSLGPHFCPSLGVKGFLNSDGNPFNDQVH